MEEVKKKNKSAMIGNVFCALAVLFGLAAFLLYRKNGVNEFSPELSKEAVIWLLLGVACCAASFFLRFRIVRYIGYLVMLYAFMWFVNSQVTYIANVFVSIDGNTFTPGFLATAAAYILAFVTALLGAVLSRRKGAQENV